jgi:Terminase large subunit, T4likevirus-type, N-terminal
VAVTTVRDESGRYVREWKPTDKQNEFIQIPFEVFEGFFGGSAGPGKSELLFMLPVLYDFHQYAGFQGVLFRESYPQLEASLIKRAVPIYNLFGASYDSTKHVSTFPSGAQIRFNYLESDKDARQHDTNEYQYIAFDELTAFNEFRYTFLTSRVRSVIDGVPPIVRSASNPGNVGHLWVRQRFVEGAPQGGSLLYDENSETYRIFIRAFLTDNPYLLLKDPGYLKRLRLLPLAEQRAKIYGDWWVFAGQVFTEWRDPFFGTQFPDEPTNACHVIDDWSPPLWMPRLVACDWGYHPGKVWVGWFAATPDRRAILYRERVWSKTNISVWGSDVARITESELEAVKSCKLDPSAWGHRGEDKTIAEQIIDATGLPFDKADNDRIGGKALMHEYLRWSPKPPSYTPIGGYSEELAFKILRNGGPEKYKEYIALFKEEEPETNLPKLLVCKSCVDFRKTIPACVYPEEEKPGIKAEDVKQFIGDDAYDGGRYGIKAIDDFFNLSSNEARKVDQLGQIVMALEQSGDWNTYYRQMAKYDKEYRRNTQSIQRHQGRFNANLSRRFRFKSL